jgi:hypothetical protein
MRTSRQLVTSAGALLASSFVLSALSVFARPPQGNGPRPSDRRAAAPEVVIDAMSIPKKTPEKLAEELRASKRWRDVKINRGDGVYLQASNGDTESVSIQWVKGKPFFVLMNLPQKSPHDPFAILRLAGISGAPEPTSKTSTGPVFGGPQWEWKNGFGPFKWVRVRTRNLEVQMKPGWTGTGLELYFVTKAAYDRWVKAG